MSGQKLIFSFKDGLNLALDEKKVAQGGIINFDMDYGQVNLDYEGHLLRVADHEEVESLKSVIRISAKEEASKRRKKSDETAKGTPEVQNSTGKVSQLRSMVMTPEGNLVGAPADKAPLRRTQRRNANRRKHKALDRQERRRAKESVTEPVAVVEGEEHAPPEEEKFTQFPMGRDDHEVKMEPLLLESMPTEPCMGCPRCNANIVRPILPGYTPTGAFTECPECNVLHLERYGSLEEYVATSRELRSQEHPDVEPYVPQFFEPRRPQTISDYVMTKIRRVRKQEFEHYEEIQGKFVNILEGLELYTNVFSERDESKILSCVFNLMDLGRAGRLREKTYSEPSKWKRGKGRITIQCGCCYNFAKDRQGNPPGILRNDEVDPLPSVIKNMIKRMVEWRILPADCIPNSCIINIYEEGDCIPPHIDHHDFVRPFCTVSFMSKSNILFGREIQIVGPGEFRGTVEIPLPVGSVLILKGNGADLAKHCIPGVTRRRVSVTFRRMDDSKAPYGYRPDPDLEGLRPLKW